MVHEAAAHVSSGALFGLVLAVQLGIARPRRLVLRDLRGCGALEEADGVATAAETDRNVSHANGGACPRLAVCVCVCHEHQRSRSAHCFSRGYSRRLLVVGAPPLVAIAIPRHRSRRSHPLRPRPRARPLRWLARLPIPRRQGLRNPCPRCTPGTPRRRHGAAWYDGYRASTTEEPLSADPDRRVRRRLLGDLPLSLRQGLQQRPPDGGYPAP